MNKPYTDNYRKPIESTGKSTEANEAVRKMMERQRATRENSEQIINYYKNGQRG